MQCTRSVLLILPVLFIILNTPLQAKTVYVTDTIKITMRNGPSTRNKILKMLPSGTRLEIIDQASGWAKVATAEGKTGWVIAKYTMDQPPKDFLIQELKKDLAEQKTLNKEQQSKISELQTAKDRFKKLANDSSNNLTGLEKQVSYLQQELKQAKKNDKRKWFLYGAGIVGGSALVGFLFGRIRRKQSSKLHF